MQGFNANYIEQKAEWRECPRAGKKLNPPASLNYVVVFTLKMLYKLQHSLDLIESRGPIQYGNSNELSSGFRVLTGNKIGSQAEQGARRYETHAIFAASALDKSPDGNNPLLLATRPYCDINQ